MRSEKAGTTGVPKSMSRMRCVAAPAWRRFLRRAEREVGEGHFDQAALSLERALVGADSYASLLRIADLYRSMQRWPAALTAAEKAARHAPGRLPAHEMTLAIALEAGDRRRVIAAGKALIKIAPRHLPAHNALGAVYIQLGDVEAAMRAANTLIRLDPQNAAHHFKKGLLCQHKGEIALAVHEFMQTIRLESDGPHAAAARESLEALDTYQLNQIATLVMEDMVFRAKIAREPLEAAFERGFILSDIGNQVLTELSANNLADLPEPCRPSLYN